MFSCKKPDRKEFLGKWESDDKAMIILNEDSTCIVQNFDMEKIWGSYNEPAIKEKLNGKGKWKFVHPTKYLSHYCIYVDLKGSFPLCVTGTGMTGYFRPWKLFIYIGDPDNMNLYEFYKK
jgi:hypothetical protein